VQEQGNEPVVHEQGIDDEEWIYHPPGNLFPTKGDPESAVREPEFKQHSDYVALSDLPLILRKVAFDEPLNGQSFLFMAETEISNAMFAQYLSATSQLRDDTLLEDFLRKLDQSGRFSTATPVITILDRESLWRKGDVPDGRDHHPVSFVTLGDAIGFCEWLNVRYRADGEFRLPTDREWLAAAYGANRDYPWGNQTKNFEAESTREVDTESELRTPDGLYWMWGNVSELVLTDSDGYGGSIEDFRDPMITRWLGPHFADDRCDPREDYWGYTHSNVSRADTWGFRIVCVPTEPKS
jgi:formylglycine-generating enzyme required for sulfatase activity